MNNRIDLQKSLKPSWIWAIALGSSIGWGAFVQPTNWMETAGPMGVIIGFLIGAILMMIIAVSYGVLIKDFPVSGGEFAYTFLSLGRTHAFICGWFLTLGYICIVALNASAFSLMIKFIFPRFIENMKLYNIAGWDIYFTEIILSTLIIVIFSVFNIIGSGFSGRTQLILCLIMVLSVISLTFSVGISPTSSIDNLVPLFNPETTTLASILAIVAIAPWAYVGFDNVPQAAEEFNFPSKRAFSLIIFAIIAAAMLYSFMILTTAIAEPWINSINENHLWGTGVIIKNSLGTIGIFVLVIALSMGIFTGLNGFIFSSSRLLFAMSRAKVIPMSFSRLHSKYNTPYIAIMFTGIISMLAPWFGREVLLWVVDMSSIGVSIAYFYTTYAAFKYLRKNSKNHIKLSISILGVISSLVFILLLLIPGSPAFLGIESRIALIIWVVLGLVLYLTKRKEFNHIPEKDLYYLIIGKEKK